MASQQPEPLTLSPEDLDTGLVDLRRRASARAVEQVLLETDLDAD
jgi:hypothetical protein